MQETDWSFLLFTPSDQASWLHADWATTFFSKRDHIWRSHTPCPNCCRNGCVFGKHCAFAKRPSTQSGVCALEATETFNEMQRVFSGHGSRSSDTSDDDDAEPAKPVEPLCASAVEFRPRQLVKRGWPVESKPTTEFSLSFYAYMRHYGLTMLMEVRHDGLVMTARRHKTAASIRQLVQQFAHRRVRAYFEYKLGQMLICEDARHEPAYPLSIGDIATRFRCHYKQCASQDLYGRITVTLNDELRPPMGCFNCRACHRVTYISVYETCS